VHDLRSNGIWLQHGWLGDDAWFVRYGRDPLLFRNDDAVRVLARKLAAHNIVDIFPHLCPSRSDGRIPSVDPDQTDRFLREFENFRVIPWVGGVLDVHVFLASENWRETFIASILELLQQHPHLAGVHVNIEPLPAGNQDFLTLLEELRAALPEGRILSVAAHPPPTLWQPSPEVHWDQAYFGAVSERVDQMAVMMYDTAIKLEKPYQSLLALWTVDVLEWAGDTPVLLGLPTYDDAGVGYHSPRVENLSNGLLGVHAGLSQYQRLPSNYQGIALYSEWEMDEAEWEYLSKHFNRRVE